MFRRLLNRWGLTYIRLDGLESTLWKHAAHHAPFSYRLLRRSVAIARLDQSLGEHFSDWQQLKPRLLKGDLIWPFEFNPQTLAMRRGFVVIRSGRPLTGIVTHSS